MQQCSLILKQHYNDNVDFSKLHVKIIMMIVFNLFTFFGLLCREKVIS